MGDDQEGKLAYGTDILYTDAANGKEDLQKYYQIWELYLQNKGTEEPLVTDNSYGYNYTAVAPILDENGKAIAEIQYILDMQSVRNHLNSFLRDMLMISLVIISAALLIYMLGMEKIVLNPVKKLAHFTGNIIQEGRFEKQKIEISTGDEIEELGGAVNVMIEKLEEYWGVNTPPAEQYLSWLKDFVRGDMGISLLYRQPVGKVIAVKLANSLFLMILAWVLSGILGFVLGVVAGMNRGKLVDKLIKGYCLVISSTPAFWLALLLLMVFGVWLGWLPIGLSVPIGVEASGVTFLDRLYHAVLPALTLSITGVSNIALHTREKMIDICESDYVLFARMRGEKGFRLFRYYGFRNVLLPAITLQFASISEIFGGSVLVEQVFSYPGLGQAAVAAGLGSDLPLLMAITIVSALFVFGGNMIANLLYGVVDPRIRRGGTSK